MDNKIIQYLYEEAKKASEKSYSPYSKFTVGAAVMMNDDTIIYGANVENGSFGGTICAERSALTFIGKEGIGKIKAIGIYAPAESVPPCGICRQFIIEFGDDIDIVFKYKGEIICKKISELLPYKFEF